MSTGPIFLDTRLAQVAQSLGQQTPEPQTTPTAGNQPTQPANQPAEPTATTPVAAQVASEVEMALARNRPPPNGLTQERYLDLVRRYGLTRANLVARGVLQEVPPAAGSTGTARLSFNTATKDPIGLLGRSLGPYAAAQQPVTQTAANPSDKTVSNASQSNQVESNQPVSTSAVAPASTESKALDDKVAQMNALRNEVVELHAAWLKATDPATRQSLQSQLEAKSSSLYRMVQELPTVLPEGNNNQMLREALSARDQEVVAVQERWGVDARGKPLQKAEKDIAKYLFSDVKALLPPLSAATLRQSPTGADNPLTPWLTTFGVWTFYNAQSQPQKGTER